MAESVFRSPPDDGTTIAVRRWPIERQAPRAIVQIAHGLAEH